MLQTTGENLAAVNNKTIVTLLQNHPPIFVILSLQRCKSHFFPAGSWLSSPNRGLRRNLEGWMKEKEVALSYLPSLSVSISSFPWLHHPASFPVFSQFSVPPSSHSSELSAWVADAEFQKP